MESGHNSDDTAAAAVYGKVTERYEEALANSMKVIGCLLAHSFIVVILMTQTPECTVNGIGIETMLSASLAVCLFLALAMAVLRAYKSNPTALRIMARKTSIIAADTRLHPTVSPLLTIAVNRSASYLKQPHRLIRRV